MAGRQWLVTPFFALAWTNALAILVTVALGRAFRIFIRIRALHNAPPAGQPPWPGHAERNTAEGRGWHELLEGVRNVVTLGNVQVPYVPPTTTRGIVTRFLRQLPGQLGRYWRSIATGFGYILLFVAFQTCGVFTTIYLQTDGLALSDHPDCGTYFPRPKAGDSLGLKNATTLYEFDVQSDSAALVRNCYNADGKPDGCSFFLNQSIAYDVSDAACPFDDELCFGGDAVPVRFSTGAVDARIIGINAPKTFEFNRTTVCSPLNMNTTYIREREKKSTDCKWTFDYFYGPAAGGAQGTSTWTSYRYGGIGDAPTYDVG
jgi:hypothetical protein